MIFNVLKNFEKKVLFSSLSFPAKEVQASEMQEGFILRARDFPFSNQKKNKSDVGSIGLKLRKLWGGLGLLCIQGLLEMIDNGEKSKHRSENEGEKLILPI